MDLKYELTEEDKRWQQEAADWLDNEVPHEWRHQSAFEPSGGAYGTDEEFAKQKNFTKAIADKGWLKLAWPEEWGGKDASPRQMRILSREIGKRRLRIMRMMDLPPMIFAHGTEEQKKKWLPILGSGEHATCLILTEPDAGSDLANLKTRAVLDGDEWVINGLKHFLHGAHRADFGQLMALTDPNAPKRRGLSRFIIDMRTPGLTIRPMIDMGGYHAVNECYFDDVRLPKENLVGKLNNGWYETNLDRGGQFPGGFAEGGGGRSVIERLVEFTKETKRNGKPLNTDPRIRQKIAAAAVLEDILFWFMEQGFGRSEQFYSDPEAARRAFIAAAREGGVQQIAGTMPTIMRKEFTPRVAEAVLQVLGPLGQVRSGSKWAPLHGWAERDWRTSATETHAHGTIEILKMVMATRAFGLPRG